MSILDEIYPQTTEELAYAKSLLSEELKARNLSGIPSVDKPWHKYYTKEQLAVQPPQISLCDYLYERNKNNLDLFAFNYLGKRVTYEEFFNRVEDTAKRFQKHGVKEQDYISLAMPVCPETMYMVYALDKIGACASLIDPRINAERMSYYLSLVDSAIAGITGVYAHTMRQALDTQKNMTMLNISPLQSFDGEKQGLKALYNLKMLSENCKELLFNLQNAKKGLNIITSKKFYSGNMSNVSLQIPEYKKDRVAVVEYTSGTTGVPKGLELTAASINLVVEQLKDLIETVPGETILGIMPPFISYGIVCGTHNALACGLESILIPKFSPDIFPSLITNHKPNHIVCVPSFLQLFMQSELVGKTDDLSFIRNIIVGGDKTTVEFELEFHRWLESHNCNTKISKGGGMAEYASCLFFTPYPETKKLGCYGIPMPAVEAKIVDDSGKECGYYEVGELHISSAQNMKGYVNNPESTNEFFYTENGKKFGRTGDLGYVDINGVFTLLGRKKAMVIRPDGHNVFPSEITSVILRHKAVQDCLTVGIDNDNGIGQWPTAFIELKPEYIEQSEKVLSDIMKLCAEKLPLRDRPRTEDYFIVKKIRITTEGKIDAKATIALDNRM